jgi:hypothetical protein
VSVYRLRNRLLLFQSIDTPQTQDECDGTPSGSSQDTPLTPTGQREFGFEGIRVFDVTRPTRPRYLTAVPTACGSHTHTLIPDERRDCVLLYVSSYPLGSSITPGDPPPALESRYSIPRPQASQVCVSHNANVIPTERGYYMVAAYYEGGNTVVDFSDVEEPQEIAFADPRDQIGCADSWSTYWYNDLVVVNGGLGSAPALSGPAGTRFRLASDQSHPLHRVALLDQLVHGPVDPLA